MYWTQPKQNTSSGGGFFLVEIDKVIVKLKWAYKEPIIARTILKKKITVGGLVLSNFQELL